MIADKWANNAVTVEKVIRTSCRVVRKICDPLLAGGNDMDSIIRESPIDNGQERGER